MNRKSVFLACLVLLFLSPSAQALTFTVNIAVDDFGRSSEFSARVQLEDIPPGLIFRDGFED